MRFRTEYITDRAGFTLDTRKPALFLGSCFADNMAAKMSSCLWEAVNPFGALYNPLSIARVLEASEEVWDGISVEDGIFGKSLFEAEGKWHSWLLGSSFSAEKRVDAIDNFREKALRLKDALEKGRILFVTFGTAWCYWLDGDDYPVGNCHKQPAAMFRRRRLSAEVITGLWRETAARLEGRFPGMRFIFTVSPVRHLKDGLEGNARSKAVLLLAVEELCGASAECSYFPAYEIVNDDLRDYRFYASDLVHPSGEAVEYIWEKFKDSYLNAEGIARLKEGESIRKALDHRPMPDATRTPSAEAMAREAARIAKAEERLKNWSGLKA